MTRVLLTLGVLLVVAGLYALMLKGWRGRQRRQGDLPPPSAAPEPRGQVLVGAVPGLFVGTTYAGSWLDRVAVHALGVRAAGWLVVSTDGVHVEREGEPELFVPYASLEGVGLGQALAGKVVRPGGLLLLDWRLGNALLTSGFRADDQDTHPRLVAQVEDELTRRAVRP